MAVKAALLKRNELSDQKRLQELLSREELGDRRPTQVLRRMRQLVGDTVFDGKVLRALFIQKLPAAVQQIMVTAEDSVSLETMAEMAERIIEVTTPQISNISSSATSAAASEISQLRAEVAELKNMMKNMSTGAASGRGRSNSRGRSPYRKQRDINKHPLCWYHHKFREKSTKCESPCSWSGNDQRSLSK